ncbi:MAG: hypothetical protein COT16_01855 [Elusimicrobia bacterium CG08_land_8_20_14_0_20_44_26]|nr:MAG: hypothetical protein COT16_01855 [Elusimicrobia bacterium CG08_land_8_20_14_0_20_44_26]
MEKSGTEESEVKKNGDGGKLGIIGIIIYLLSSVPLFLSAEGDRFQFCVLKHGGVFNPHPTAYENIVKFLNSTTSIDPTQEEIAFVAVSDEIFKYPFLYLAAKGRMPDFSKADIALIARHLRSGGFLFIDETDDYGAGDFKESLEKFFREIFPDLKIEKIPQDDVIFKAFYLKPKASGRIDRSPFLYGLNLDGRWAAVVSGNDIAGAWARDDLGRFLYDCSPGGEPQRMEAIKLTVNIIMYSLTGTYKQDIIHEKFIEMKLRSW